MRLGDIGEWGFIERIMEHSIVRPGGVIQGIGDDCAVLACPGGEHLLVTTDMLVEGVHFQRDTTSFYQLGWKSLAVNLSDIAAMAGRPLDSFLSLAVPPGIEIDDLDAFYAGFRALAALHGVNLVGGDTCRALKDLVITVTVTGAAPEGRILYRRGAREGDRIAVTGTLGDSAAGLEILRSRKAIPEEIRASLVKAHLMPEPHLEEARFLASQEGVHAAIDVSDGLSVDLRHLCAPDGLGAIVEQASLPLSPELCSFAKASHRSAEGLALNGGEDYVLLVALAPEHAESIALAYQKRFDKSLYVVGTFCRGPFVGIKDLQGATRELPAGGYDHFRVHP